MSEKKYLVLSDGTVFEGRALGAGGEAIGEVTFNTSVLGFTETLTDACSYGQIVIQTFPTVGNYGICEADAAGAPTVRGYGVAEACLTPSNFRSDTTLHDYLAKNGVVGIEGIDTRALTKKIRDEGTKNGILCDIPPADLEKVKYFSPRGGSDGLSAKEAVR
ncbi:MAG: carbamoyl phosphate synthase small subunit, partial [Clostridia bacterium]|nr:carbamoyl phosphate synthase small subunit [Clostridia bacterium]